MKYLLCTALLISFLLTACESTNPMCSGVTDTVAVTDTVKTLVTEHDTAFIKDTIVRVDTVGILHTITDSIFVVKPILVRDTIVVEPPVADVQVILDCVADTYTQGFKKNIRIYLGQNIISTLDYGLMDTVYVKDGSMLVCKMYNTKLETEIVDSVRVYERMVWQIDRIIGE